ncbi:MAG: metal-dependent transcriptional regulator [Pleomorphochaeta sp.]
MSNTISKTLQDYLKIILIEAQFTQSGYVSMGKLAQKMDLTAGTVTTMIKRFTKDGWIEYKPRVGCCLSEKGNLEAVKLLYKHRLLEYFLETTLKMDWKEVHKEAEHLEHELSDKVLEYLDKFLDYPKEDPHNQPIFRNIVEFKNYYKQNFNTLDTAEQNYTYTVEKIINNEDSEFRNYLIENNLLPGSTFTVISKSIPGGWIEVKVLNHKPVHFSFESGKKIIIRLQE